MFVSSQLQSFRERVQEHINIHGIGGVGAYTVFSSVSNCNTSESTSRDDSHLHRVSDEQGVEFAFDTSWNNLEKFQAKPYSSRNLIASTIRKSAKVCLRELDQESRKEFGVANSAEIQSWLRYEAVTAALRLQYHHRDVMKMRWVLRYKESGKPKARLVLVGYHDPRVGSDVRTEALVASRRGRSLFFMATAHNQFSIEKKDVKNAFLQGTFDDTTDGEHSAEPVPELRKALNLREDEIVVLTKACYGLIDAPRRWWKSLVRDTQQWGWRSCRHEPCLMTWHVRMDKVKRLFEWGEWEQQEFDGCGCRIRQATDKSFTVDQELYARKIGLIIMSAHRRKHTSETLSDKEHTTLMAKRGELNWLATQTMIPLLAPSSSIDTSKTATGQSFKDLNRLVRQAHFEASDKLHYPVIADPVFVSFADASWANRKDFGSQCGYLFVGTQRSLLDGSAAPCCPVPWHSRKCPRVARSSGSAETQAATQAQEETEFIRLLWLEIVQGAHDDTMTDQEISQNRRLSHH